MHPRKWYERTINAELCYKSRDECRPAQSPNDSRTVLDWASVREERFEFDGLQPVAMTGGTIDHNVIAFNIHRSLFEQLTGSGCRPLGQDAGVATTANALRYPDALVTCTKSPGTDRLVSGVVVVFEVLSPSSGFIDRIVKVREYHDVSTIKRYVIVEHSSMGVTVLTRDNVDDPWAATTLTADDRLQMPELGIEIAVADFYEGTDVPRATDETSGATREGEEKGTV